MTNCRDFGKVVSIRLGLRVQKYTIIYQVCFWECMKNGSFFVAFFIMVFLTFVWVVWSD